MKKTIEDEAVKWALRLLIVSKAIEDFNNLGKSIKNLFPENEPVLDCMGLVNEAIVTELERINRELEILKIQAGIGDKNV